MPVFVRAARVLECVCAGALLLAQSSPDPVRESGIASALVQAGKPEEAIPIYRKLATAYPHELSLQLNLVVALYKAGHYEETVSQCGTLVKTAPNLFPVWLFLGAAKAKLGDAAGAEEPLRKAVSLNADDVNARIILADAMAATGRYAEAVTHYSTAAERIPSLPRSWYGLGLNYELLARESLARLNEHAPSSPEALALSGDLDLDSAQIAKAFLHFRQALHLRPDFPGLHAKLAEVYAAAGHPDWAATESHNERERRPTACQSDSLLECDVQARNLEKAASAPAQLPQDIYWQAQAFLELSRNAYSKLNALPPSPESYEAAARREENRGRYPEAVAAWQKALQLDQKSQELQRGLVLAQCRNNDCVSALPLLRQAITEHPVSAEWNYLYGLSLVTIREPLKAISYLQTSLRLDPSFSPVSGVLGEAYLEAGKPEEAIASLKAALPHDETGSRHYQLALAYRAAGKEAQARDMLRRYREIIETTRTQDAPISAITPP